MLVLDSSLRKPCLSDPTTGDEETEIFFIEFFVKFINRIPTQHRTPTFGISYIFAPKIYKL
jgi:hypothetical protein